MKLDGNRSLAQILIFILNVILVFGIIMTTMVYYNTFIVCRADLKEINIFVMLILLTIGIGCIFLIVLDLKRIVGTVTNGTPFVLENVKALNRIARECFIIAFCYLLNIVVNIGKDTYNFIYIDSNGIHTDTELIIFLLAGGFIIVLSAVFKEAIKYKEENDYTI